MQFIITWATFRSGNITEGLGTGLKAGGDYVIESTRTSAQDVIQDIFNKMVTADSSETATTVRLLGSMQNYLEGTDEAEAAIELPGSCAWFFTAKKVVAGEKPAQRDPIDVLLDEIFDEGEVAELMLDAEAIEAEDPALVRDFLAEASEIDQAEVLSDAVSDGLTEAAELLALDPDFADERGQSIIARMKKNALNTRAYYGKDYRSEMARHGHTEIYK